VGVFVLSSVLITTTDDLAIQGVLVLAWLFTFLYAPFLVAVFSFQRIRNWNKKRRGLEESVGKTTTVTVYECGHCKKEYTNAEYCPHCRSPYRRIVKETIEREPLGSNRPRMIR
jgi:hypothetical protein